MAFVAAKVRATRVSVGWWCLPVCLLMWLIVGDAFGENLENVSKASRMAQLKSMQQLDATTSRGDASTYFPLGQDDLRGIPRTRELRGRRIPKVCLVDEVSAAGLGARSVPLPEANTLFHVNYMQGRFGRVQGSNGRVRLFNPEVILVKFKNNDRVAALRVEAGLELEVVRRLYEREDVVFAELDTLETPAGVSNDPFLANQWHHEAIRSFDAWNFGIAQSPVRVAIIDTPFQMDHPDLSGNVAPGWDVVTGQPVVASAGIDHSTLAAGLIAAVPNNGLGVAGVGNCIVLPINITASISDMCNAVYWAATNDVRVVNISWTGAESYSLNEAAHFFTANARGLVIMAGGNDLNQPDLPNQPDIWCVSMTDAAENQRSSHGALIDFAAPGWEVYSTTIGGGYGYGWGTSFSTPVVAGVCARLFSMNPTLGPEDVIDILKRTAVDLGEPGWDMWFGWGRIDFGAAAAMAASRGPAISVLSRSLTEVTFAIDPIPDYTCELWKTSSIETNSWSRVDDVIAGTNGSQITFTVPVFSNSSEFFKATFRKK